jgi:hypothetical protein
MYISIFEQISGKKTKYSSFADREYSSDVVHTLDDIERMQKRESLTPLCAYNLIQHPARILKAFFEFNSNFPSKNKLDIVNSIVSLSLSVYSQKKSSYEVKNLKKTINQSNPSFLSWPVRYAQDSISWKASHPSLSFETARSLIEKACAQDILLISLANGAFPASVDIFLRYNSESSREDSVLYPVRFSRNKCLDDLPVISREEKGYLKSMSDGREIVIFDEDSFTQNTLKTASYYFKRVLEREYVITATNYLSVLGQMCPPKGFVEIS